MRHVSPTASPSPGTEKGSFQASPLFHSSLWDLSVRQLCLPLSACTSGARGSWGEGHPRCRSPGMGFQAWSVPTDHTVPGISDERQAILGSSFRPNVLPCRIRCPTLGGQEETGGASHSENGLDCAGSPWRQFFPATVFPGVSMSPTEWDHQLACILSRLPLMLCDLGLKKWQNYKKQKRL